MESRLLIGIVTGGFLAVSFVLSGMEAGVFAVTPARLREPVSSGARTATQLRRYREDPETFLWTILLGSALANGWILGWTLMQLARLIGVQHPVWVTLGYVITVVVQYACFDRVPKRLFERYPDRLCMLLAVPVGMVCRALRPLVWLVRRGAGLPPPRPHSFD